MAHEHQGNLPSLVEMRKTDLQDLLNRQEKILANKKFLRTLPDRGQKIEAFTDKLKRAIKEREDVEKTAESFKKMDLGASCMAEGVIERIPAVTKPLKDQTHEDIVVTSHRTEKSKANLNVLSETDAKVTKQTFFPYKSLKSTTIPEGLTRPCVPQAKSSPAKPSDAFKPPENSAVVPPLMRHPGTKPVDFYESTQLLEEQKKKVEELQAQQAAGRLAERMHIKLGQYSPASPDMRYREQEQDEGSDDDSDEESDTEEEEGEENV